MECGAAHAVWQPGDTDLDVELEVEGSPLWQSGYTPPPSDFELGGGSFFDYIRTSPVNDSPCALPEEHEHVRGAADLERAELIRTYVEELPDLAKTTRPQAENPPLEYRLDRDATVKMLGKYRGGRLKVAMETCKLVCMRVCENGVFGSTEHFCRCDGKHAQGGGIRGGLHRARACQTCKDLKNGVGFQKNGGV